VTNAAFYQIQFLPGPDGQLRWVPAAREFRRDDREAIDHQEKKNGSSERKVFYDDGRGRRLVYEVDSERDSYRYVLEKDDQSAGGVQRTVFPTLHRAVFSLSGCVSRNE
jgi:hypothetical protein